MFTAIESMLFSKPGGKFVRGFGDTWVCGESWLDSLTHCPSSQGWAPKCPLGSIYFVLLPRMVSGSGLPFFLPYKS